jgi:hypothetical protein
MAAVSVIVVSYNDLQHLRHLLPSIKCQSFREFELIVVDNARNAAVQKYVSALRGKWSQRVVYVPSLNEGYPGGNMLGSRYAKGDYVMVLNPDTFLEKRAIEFMVRDFSKKSNQVMVLVPKILIRQTDTINSIGMRRIRPSENIYTNIGYLEHDVGQYDVPQRVEAFDGSAFMFRRRLLRYTYLFDPRFFFGNETVDLAERMRKLGFSAYTCPRAVVRHYLRGTVTSSKENDKLTMIIVRNALIHTLRNTDTIMFFRTLIIGMCIRNIFGRLLMGQNRRIAISYLRGVMMFIIQLGKFKNAPCLVKHATSCRRTCLRP